MPAMAIPTTQKTIVVPAIGGREVVEIVDAPVPVPAANEVLIKNEFGGLNFVDSYFRSGLYPCALPYVVGREAAGVIVAIGANVTQYAVGDRVGFLGPGAFAEYVALPETGTITLLPEAVSTEIAAAAMLQGMTALTLITEAYTVKAGDYVLVQAAAGGVGLLLCQLISKLGGHVIGTVSTPAKEALARAAGAEFVINYTDLPDYVAKVMEITHGNGCEAVYDGVGKATFDNSFKCLRRKGTIVPFGNASGPVPPVNLGLLTSKNAKILRPTLFNYLVTHEEWVDLTTVLWEKVAEGLKIDVYKVFPFTEYVDAAAALETRLSTAKVLIGF
ncbi:uncharacterized protein V1518DRAFT_423747 [Limtongia smithiae]|uniref:uncharacterized protein n=1 Tax=Limtongia smithiae TaxID=1125753 RepID=UPI0034CE1956